MRMLSKLAIHAPALEMICVAQVIEGFWRSPDLRESLFALAGLGDLENQGFAVACGPHVSV
jgi:hypothetical protein